MFISTFLFQKVLLTFVDVMLRFAGIDRAAVLPGGERGLPRH
jgi:hypothetical protein